MTSEKITDLVKALIKAKGQFKKVEKTCENPFFNSKYADLGTIDEAVTPALHANGLIVVQTTEIVNGSPVLVTTLIHESGQWISGQYPLNPVKNDPQALGSATTYARRYALSALLTVVADDDDDGNAASTPTKPTYQSKPQQPTTAGGVGTVTFIPTSVSVKHGEKNGKSWSKYGIQSPDGEWYGTFDENLGHLAGEAKAGSFPITVGFTVSGKYKNVATLVKAEQEELEEAPFA